MLGRIVWDSVLEASVSSLSPGQAGPFWDAGPRGWRGAGGRLLTRLSCVPSYPYSEDCSQGRQYMNTRCPAWCDRVLMSPSAKELILRVSEAWRAGGGAGPAPGAPSCRQ